MRDACSKVCGRWWLIQGQPAGHGHGEGGGEQLPCTCVSGAVVGAKPALSSVTRMGRGLGPGD